LRLVYSDFSVACVENKLVCGNLPAFSQRKQGCGKLPACSQRKQRRLFALRTSWLAANLQKTSLCFIKSTDSFFGPSAIIYFEFECDTFDCLIVIKPKK